MASTMADLANISKDPLESGVYDMFLQYADLMKVVPWSTIGDMKVAISRWVKLPTVGYRAVNGTYTESTGNFEQLEEAVAIIGGEVDSDVQFEGNKSQDQSMIDLQMEGKVRALSFKMGTDLVNGDRAITPLGFDGLKVRIDNLPARQKIAAAGTGADLAVFASDANLNLFWDVLEQAMFTLDQGVCDFILADEVAVRGIFSAARRLSKPTDVMSLIINGKKMNIPTLKLPGSSIPVVISGFTDESQGTKVIPTTETGLGGGSTTSLYLGRFGDDDLQYLTGIQKHPLRTAKFGGELGIETKPAKRVRLEWTPGLAHFNDRALVRIHSLRFATS